MSFSGSLLFNVVSGTLEATSVTSFPVSNPSSTVSLLSSSSSKSSKSSCKVSSGFGATLAADLLA